MKPLICHIILLMCVLCVAAQQDTLKAPYQRYPSVPPLRLLMADSATIFTKNDLPKNKAVFIMLFSPECSHCQHETEELIAHIDAFKKIEIVMATNYPVWEMKAFIEKYKLTNYANIHVGRDYQFILPSFFMIKNIPFLAFYDKKGNLLEGHDGTMPTDEILEKYKN